MGVKSPPLGLQMPFSVTPPGDPCGGPAGFQAVSPVAKHKRGSGEAGPWVLPQGGCLKSSESLDLQRGWGRAGWSRLQDLKGN